VGYTPLNNSLGYFYGGGGGAAVAVIRQGSSHFHSELQNVIKFE
jgi:hypothetical protein